MSCTTVGELSGARPDQLARPSVANPLRLRTKSRFNVPEICETIIWQFLEMHPYLFEEAADTSVMDSLRLSWPVPLPTLVR
eukprot:scaffold60919_cov39-Prasinocladus_malaysianus.AAC.1